MAVLTLTSAQHQDIEQRRQRTNHKRIADRLAALLWLADGETEKDVGRRLGVDRKTIGEWVQTFRSQGLDGLCTLHYQGDPGELSVEQIAQLKDEAAKGVFRSAKQIAAWIKERFQVSYSESGVKALMHRIGVSYHKSSGFLWKADRAAQEQFVDQFEVDAPSFGKSETTRRYFVDGCHPIWGLECLFAAWLLVGQRLNVGIGSGRKRLNILGAYSPDDHDYVDIRTADENLNAQTVIALLEKLQARHPDTTKFVIYLDNARYQHAKLVRAWVAEHPQFELRFLPPYSPNLNLIERLWKFLRKHALSCWHETFAAMQTAVGNVLDHLDRYQEELKTLMTPKFHLVEAKT